MDRSYIQDAPASTSQVPDLVRKVAIPMEIMHELEAADMHGLAKDIIFWVVYRCLTTRRRSCGLHQGLLDRSVGHRIRKQVIAFIRSSAHIRPALNGLYRSGRQCIQYELVGVSTVSDDVDHHNSGDIFISASCADVVDGFISWRTVDFGFLMEKVFTGFKKIGWDVSTLQAEWSLGQMDAPTMTADDVRDHISDTAQAAAHTQALDRLTERPTERVFRRDGRTYTAVTSLPEWIRTQEIRFAGGAETLDISCCYLWCLAADHRLSRIRNGLDTSEIDGLMDMIEAGDFYTKISEIAGVDTAAAKEDFNKFCIFGPIGWHPLWHALQSISPRICRDIRWWREQPGGATRLAYFLMRAEGQLMTDGLIDWLVSGGLPGVQVHDGCIVPSGEAQVAAEWLSQHSRTIYGRSCRIAVVIDGRKSYVTGQTQTGGVA